MACPVHGPHRESDHVPIMAAAQNVQEARRMMGRSCSIKIMAMPAPMGNMDSSQIPSAEHRALMKNLFSLTDKYYDLMFVEGKHFEFEKLDRQGKLKAAMKMLKDPRLTDFLLFQIDMTSPMFEWKLLEYGPFQKAYPETHARIMARMNAK